MFCQDFVIEDGKKNMRKEDSIQTIKGIGEKTAESFARLGIFTIDDLLHTYPRNYLSYEERVYSGCSSWRAACNPGDDHLLCDRQAGAELKAYNPDRQ